MPFLDEQELKSLHKEIHEANVKHDELETELSNREEELTKTKKKARGTNIFFGILAGISLAGALYLYMNKANVATSSPSVVTEEVVEEIDNNEPIEEETIADVKTVDENITDLKQGISGETIYSVQIGVFSTNKFPLLSETIAGTTSQGKLFKYSVGLFKTLEEARAFRKQLVKIGFRDAFVASYVDGERQEIHKPN